jgi:hypothetical protein
MPLPTEILEGFEAEELKTDATLVRFNSVEDLAKSYLESRSGNVIRVPGPDASAEAWTEYANKQIHSAPDLIMLKPDMENKEQSEAFWITAGKPGAADQYAVPEGANLPPEVETELRELAFDGNITQAQFAIQYKGMSDRFAKTLENNTANQTADVDELKGKWGQAYDDRIAAAKAINEDVYPGRDFASLTPIELQGLYTTHERLTGKGPQVATQLEAQSRAMTPDEARAQAGEIMDRLMDPKSDLSQMESKRLAQKRVDLLVKYDPAFAATG